jgi:4-amino-4-deoxy-L-arabinose transferase-like glycosyltransferase
MILAKTQPNNPAATAHQQRVMRFLPLALTIVAGLLCYGLFYNRGAWLSVIGYSVSPAERVMQGEVPYRDFLYNYTPGMLWLNASLMQVFGTTLLTIHLGLLVVKLATLVVLYVAAKRLVGAWAALMPVALSLSWIGYKYIFGVFPTQYSMLFILLGIIFMLKHDESGRLAFLLLSGVSVGVVFLFKYNVGILLFGCGTLAIIIRELTIPGPFVTQDAIGGKSFSRNAPAGAIAQQPFTDPSLSQRVLVALKKSFIYWLGFALGLLPLSFYLLYHHALGAMVDHFIHHASAYGGERAVALPSLKLLAPTLAGLVIVTVGAVVIIRKAQRFFQAYLITVFSLAAIALLIPNRAFIIKNSAIAFMAYLPIFLFAGVTLVLLWRLKKESGAGSQESGVRSQESEVRDSLSESRSQDSEEVDSANQSPLHLFTSSPPLLHSPPPLPLLTNWWQQSGALVIVGLFALGAYLEMYPRADYYHLVRSLPPTFLLIVLVGAKLLPPLRNYFSRYLPSPARAMSLCCGVAVALLMLVGLVHTWLPNFDSQFRFIDRAPLTLARGQGIRVPPRQTEFVESLVELIQNNSSPDDSIFSFGQRGAGFYFLSGRRNPTKFVWWRNVGIKKEDREAVLQMIHEKHPKLILLQDSLKDPRVRDAVNLNYHKVGAASGIGVYDRKE